MATVFIPTFVSFIACTVRRLGVFDEKWFDTCSLAICPSYSIASTICDNLAYVHRARDYVSGGPPEILPIARIKQRLAHLVLDCSLATNRLATSKNGVHTNTSTCS
jgi:hypothetical protein